MQETNVLRAAYLANATFSSLCATIFILFGAWLAPRVGLSSAVPLVVVGLGLLPFAGWLVYIARGSGLTPTMGRSVRMLDANRVVGTVILLAVWPDVLNPVGKGLAVAIAAVVASFAIWQLVGARRIAAHA